MMMTSLSFNESLKVIVHFILMKLLFPNIDIFHGTSFSYFFSTATILSTVLVVSVVSVVSVVVSLSSA